ncbi:conserved hypothetical protein [groundwater metagenome]|uniref:Transposase IS66 central domain-containing protein n=1 Tax=groundwater metagenome TaxID=717931 RepID=A0A098E891_9ZZZZ
MDNTNNKINAKFKIPEEIISLDIDALGPNIPKEAKKIIVLQHNIIGQIYSAHQDLLEDYQKLRDEVNRLKGEKGKPEIKPNVSTKENTLAPDPTKEPKKWEKKSKKANIKIDKVEVVQIDKSVLPSDAIFKGYSKVIKQGIIFKTNNILYKLECYYSPSEKKTYAAKLPNALQGTNFDSDLKAFIVNLYYKGRVTEHKIKDILEEAGISISEGEISNILTKEKQSEFTDEKQDIFEAGMEHSEYVHTDSAGARHTGINHHVHVVCNTLFTAFFITRFKNKKEIRQILRLKKNEQLSKVLITDDAKQYYYLSMLHALCWIHEIRPYRKLNPFLDWQRKKLNHFLTDIWKFYELLIEYKKSPDEKQKEFLERKFDEMFSTKTEYGELDRRIELTKKQKEKLLLVLTNPKIPLHNNPAEIALRETVIKKKISYGTKSENGKTAWENMLSIMDTCRKHEVSFFSYIREIFSGERKMPKLADIIAKKAI